MVRVSLQNLFSERDKPRMDTIYNKCLIDFKFNLTRRKENTPLVRLPRRAPSELGTRTEPTSQITPGKGVIVETEVRRQGRQSTGRWGTGEDRRPRKGVKTGGKALEAARSTTQEGTA